MTLRDLLNITSSDEFLRIATKEGRNGFIAYNRVIHLDSDLEDEIKDRTVCHIYSVKKREGSWYCVELEAGLVVVIEGYENGHI